MTHTFPNAKAMNDAHEDFRLELKELREIAAKRLAQEVLELTSVPE